MTTYKKKKLKDREGNYIVTPSSADIVYCQDGSTVEQKLNNIENDEFSPTITQVESMAKVGVGTDVDVSANVQEGYVKSAILKGNTLLNLSSTPDTTLSNGKELTMFDSMYKNNTAYTFIVMADKECEITYQFFNVNAAIVGYPISLAKGVNKHKFISPSTEFTRCILRNRSADDVTFSNIMVIEGDYTNVDIPYFTGMQSVKMPVLSTCGKNLFDKNKLEDGDISSVTGNPTTTEKRSRTSNFIQVKGGSKVTLSKSTNEWFRVFGYDNNKNFVSDVINRKSSSETFAIPSNVCFIKIKFDYTLDIAMADNIQLEIRDKATAYEPYKSNILTVNEDVTLRGIGDVKDELNVLTGEAVERTGEIVLNGNESWTLVDKGEYNSFRYRLTKNFTKLNHASICNSYPIASRGELGSGSKTCIGIYYHNETENDVILNVLKTNIASIQDLKQYLQANPITIQYELATPVIKTVDLTPGGTNPTTKPYVWDGGHIQLSSEEGSLTPSLEYSVTTSRGGQILDNTRQIAKQDKRVYDLEMLLINASIDEAYKRLSLQNDVMVMNRECQTVASPLRYIMLQRLIEEKAYETQDMLDKLDVFFMYGEITDEQYFELFDIVLGIMTDTDLDITEEVE